MCPLWGHGGSLNSVGHIARNNNMRLVFAKFAARFPTLGFIMADKLTHHFLAWAWCASRYWPGIASRACAAIIMPVVLACFVKTLFAATHNCSLENVYGGAHEAQRGHHAIPAQVVYGLPVTGLF